MGVAEVINQSNTPVSIEVRKFDSQATQNAPEYFHGNDPFKSHFMNDLSILFPEGERFFIRLVLAYRCHLFSYDDADDTHRVDLVGRLTI